MKDVSNFVENVGNIKFFTSYRESMYFEIREKDKSGTFGTGLSNIFYCAFSIGYHFDKEEDKKRGSINHVNLISLDKSVKELMTLLILKRYPDIKSPKELWKKVERYAEYGIQVLYKSWSDKKILDINFVLGDG